MKSKKAKTLTKTKPSEPIDLWLKSVLATPQRPNGLSDDQKRTKIEASIKEILETLGMDLENEIGRAHV